MNGWLSPPVAPIRVVVADDDPRFLAAVSEAIQTAPSLELLAAASTVSSAIFHIETLRPDVAVVDVRMPDGGGMAIARVIRQGSMPTNVLALSAHGDEQSIARMKHAGAQHYLVKGASIEELLDAIAVVAMGADSSAGSIRPDAHDERG